MKQRAAKRVGAYFSRCGLMPGAVGADCRKDGPSLLLIGWHKPGLNEFPYQPADPVLSAIPVAADAARQPPLHGQRLAGLGLAAIGENPHPQIQNAPRFFARLIERESDMAQRCRTEVQRQQIGFIHWCPLRDARMKNINDIAFDGLIKFGYIISVATATSSLGNVFYNLLTSCRTQN